MTQERFSLKVNSKRKTVDQLYDEAVEELVDVLDDLSSEDALALGNEFRDNNGDPLLYENCESDLNDQLDGVDPYELLQMGEDWDSGDDYFSYEWGELNTTNDVWENVDTDELARVLLDGDCYYDNIPDEVQEVLDDFNEAKETLENVNKYRAEAEEVLAKYLNCEAEVGDLLQCLDKLTRADEAWAEEN